ncbi:MAG: HEAT repeat domain-containing protein [Candidatus Heimdallarchaeota archaeon]|nr:HEAT repeat domain-containing protein [Candidatus Heimdallarchaeota archaeon]
MIEEDDMTSLLESLLDEDSYVRIFTLDSIVDNQNKQLALPTLVKMLQEDVEEVRSKTAWALGKIGDRKAADSLITALKDEFWEVRRNSARSLGELMFLEAIPALVQTLEDINWEVRAETVVVLEYLGWVPSNEREEALVLIGKERWEELFKLEELDENLLINFLKDSDSEIKSKISWMLGELQATNAVDSLYQLLLTDKYQEVKEQAANAIGKIGGENVIKLLQDALKSSDWFIRKCATSALGYTRDQIAFEILKHLVNDGNRFVSESAKEALERHKSRNTI